jgi:hypothetical protein
MRLAGNSFRPHVRCRNQLDVHPEQNAALCSLLWDSNCFAATLGSAHLTYKHARIGAARLQGTDSRGAQRHIQPSSASCRLQTRLDIYEPACATAD